MFKRIKVEKMKYKNDSISYALVLLSLVVKSTKLFMKSGNTVASSPNIPNTSPMKRPVKDDK